MLSGFRAILVIGFKLIWWCIIGFELFWWCIVEFKGLHHRVQGAINRVTVSNYADPCLGFNSAFRSTVT